MVKVFKKITILSILSISVVFLSLFLVSKVPQLHSDYIRHYVGSEVVSIYGSAGGGSGFHVKTKSGDTYILTNNHVCNLANDDDMVIVHDVLKRALKRRVVKRHKTHDLCLVEAMPGFKGIATANSFYKGEVVTLVGHPSLRPLSLSKGEVIGSRKISLIIGFNLTKERCFGELYSVTEFAQGNPFLIIMLEQLGVKNICYADKLESTMFNGISYGGNSGSPVVDFYGNVVGVLYAGGQQVTDAYVVPLSVVKKFLEKF